MNKINNKIISLVKKLVVNKCSEKIIAEKEFDKKVKVNWILFVIAIATFVLVIVLSFFKSGGTFTSYEIMNGVDLKEFNSEDEIFDAKAYVQIGEANETIEFKTTSPKKEPTDEEIVDRLLTVINEDLIKNENENLSNVKSKLYLETKNTYGASICYESVHGYINIKTGDVVRNPKGLGENKDTLKVIVSYGDIKKVKEIKITILEDEKTSDEIRVENTINALKGMIKDNKLISGGKYIEEVEGVPVTFSKLHTEIKTDYLFPIKLILLAIVLVIGLYLYESYKKIIEKDKRRTEELEREFPNFIEEYMLLSRAGYTFPVAINYIASKNNKGTLRGELKRISDEINRDVIISDSLNSFAIRSGSEMIKKFILGLSSNLKRGSSHMNLYLSKELELSNIERKNGYEKRASENSTKAILPLVLILIATMLMVVYPATLALKM